MLSKTVRRINPILVSKLKELCVPKQLVEPFGLSEEDYDLPKGKFFLKVIDKSDHFDDGYGVLDSNFGQVRKLLAGDNYKKKVTLEKGKTTARYDLANAMWCPDDTREEVMSSFRGAQELFRNEMKYIHYSSDEDIKEYVKGASADLEESYNSRYLYAVEKLDSVAEDLPYVSQVSRRRKKKVKAETAFFKKLKKDVTRVGQGLRQDPLGKKVLDFVRNFHKAAKSVSLGRFLGTGFIFSFSHSKFCEKYGYKKTECNRLLNLAAGLGLITKITPVAARGIGEYWHKKFGVGVLQFMLRTVNISRALFRWYRWKASKVKIKEITIKKIEKILGVDITTHPEATDLELRKIILDANKKAEEEKALTEKESLDIRSLITEDPLDIGHKGKKYDIIPDRKYTVSDAEELLADIIKDHNDHSVNAWLNFEKEFSERTLITYKTKIKGRYVKYRKKKISELPMKLMIPEQYWMTARKPAKALISELYNQGLVGIITKSSLISEQYDWTYSYFIQTVSSLPRRRKLW